MRRNRRGAPPRKRGPAGSGGDASAAQLVRQVLEVRPADPAEVDRAAELLVELTGNQATIDRDIRLISVPMPDPAWLPVAPVPTVRSDRPAWS